MRKIAFILVVMLLLGLTGCCFAPGYEESEAMQLRLMLPGTWGSDEKDPQGSDETPEKVSREPIILAQEQQDAIAAQPARRDTDMVRLRDYIPDIFVELKYATSDNITGRIIYDFQEAYLRYGTVKKLMQVQEVLRTQGLSLKIWDAFRPAAAQSAIWEAYPNATFITNPAATYADNTYGNAVDITLVDAAGVELEMPTSFDTYTSLADRNYGDCGQEAGENATMLQELMGRSGFTYTQTSWWHFVDSDSYSAETVLDPGVISLWYANCKEYINIRSAADVTAEAVGTVPAEDTFTLLGWSGAFAYIDYNGLRGYVNGDYILQKN